MQIPDPVASGALGTQRAAPPGSSVPAVVELLPQQAMTNAVVGIAADRAQSLGGSNAAALITGYASMMDADLRITKGELKEAQQEIKSLTRELGEEKAKVQVLSAGIPHAGNAHKSQLLAVTVGGFLVTTGLEVTKISAAEKIGWGMVAFGGLIVILGWVWAWKGTA
jgi:hypothetical protein